jgi:hypothetical protein
VATDAQRFAWVDGGQLRFRLHPGQSRAWKSDARFVVVLAGTQGGKTCFGPLWLWREIQRQGPGDYLVVGPTYTLLNRKVVPELVTMFATRLRIGEYRKADNLIEITKAGERRLWGAEQDEPTRIMCGYAENPESLESATAKAAWCDESGQRKFKLGSWEAIQRRLSIHEGRALHTTTPYDFGWLKTHLVDRADGSVIDLVRFESTMNPAFSRSEYERARQELERWKFDLFYRAVFTRPAGLIYDSFRPDYHVVPEFEIPVEWPRLWGVDFGGTNTACVKFAREPDTGALFLYGEYLAGGKTIKAHAADLLRGEPVPKLAAGGSKSEGQWRREFRTSGLPLRPPKVTDVEVGISRVYAAHAQDRIFVFDTCTRYLDEKQSYSRKTDDEGQVSEDIDEKHSYHLMDAERYAIQHADALEPGRTVTAFVPT